MRAAMDITFARGPVVAASNGIAVDANHQSWGSSSSSGLSLNFHRCRVCVGVRARGSSFFTSSARGAEVLDDWESEPLIFLCHDSDACPVILSLHERDLTAALWIMKRLAERSGRCLLTRSRQESDEKSKWGRRCLEGLKGLSAAWSGQRASN